MKKTILFALILMFSGYVSASGFVINWTPSENDGYHFNQPIIAGQDFNLFMKQEMSTVYNIYTWGRYGDNWSVLDPCTGGADANLFRAPLAGCTLKNYDAINSCNSGSCEHQVTMTLNCSEGAYSIPTNYSACDYSGQEDTGFNPLEFPTLTFNVLLAIDTPPFYDYNIFWSITNDTNRHYIHAYDMNEFLDGNYFIKEFEVKVDPDCRIIRGGAKDLSKQIEVGEWHETAVNGSPNHKKYELLRKSHTFKEGSQSYNGCRDTSIKSDNPNKNYGGLAGNTIYTSIGEATIYQMLIKFENLGIPQGSIINTALLDVFMAFGSGNPVLNIFHVWKYDWNEIKATYNQWNNITLKEWGAAGAHNTNDSGTYNTMDGTGDDRKATPTDTINVTNIPNYWSVMGFDANVTSDLQKQADSNKWSGWIIKATAGSGNTTATACDGIAKQRPRLTVDWIEPNHSVEAGDYNNLNLYVDVKCNSWGFKDFNITITDADNHSIDLNTSILDINAYKYLTIQGIGIPNEGPPGVNIGGPYYMGNTGLVKADSFGVIDYKTDTNHFIESGQWRICPEGFSIPCQTEDQNCSLIESWTREDNETIISQDYNLFIGGGTAGGTIQHIYSEQFLKCNTSGKRKIMYLVQSLGTIYYDMADVFVLDLNANLKPPYYAIINEDSNINAMALDNDSYADINSAKWYAYDIECGQKTGFVLDNQTANPVGDDFNVTGTINCTTTGIKAINLFITTKNQSTGEELTAVIRGDGELTVILDDSIRIEGFEIVPSKVKKGNDVEFISAIKNKLETIDLNVEMQFNVFDDTGILIDSISVQGTAPAKGQIELKTTYNTSSLKEKTAYRVTATSFLLSGSGPMQDRQAVNDIEERYFWVLETEDKLSQLPETNFIGILLVLISITLIISTKKKRLI